MSRHATDTSSRTLVRTSCPFALKATGIKADKFNAFISPRGSQRSAGGRPRGRPFGCELSSPLAGVTEAPQEDPDRARSGIYSAWNCPAMLCRRAGPRTARIAGFRQRSMLWPTADHHQDS